MIYHVIKELPSGVKTKFPERGGEVKVFFKVKDEFNKTISEWQISKNKN